MAIMTFFSKLKKQERGVFLIDALVGIVILAIGLVAVVKLFTYGTMSRADAALREKAVQIATGRIEMLKAKEASGVDEDTLSSAIADINADTATIPVLDNEKFTATLSPLTKLSDTTTYKGDVNLRNVSSKVTWTAQDGKEDSVTLYTYVVVDQNY